MALSRLAGTNAGGCAAPVAAARVQRPMPSYMLYPLPRPPPRPPTTPAHTLHTPCTCPPQVYYFPCGRWLDAKEDDGLTRRRLKATRKDPRAFKVRACACGV